MTASAPRWVRWWFRGAAIYGTAALLSLFARTPPGGDLLFYYGFTVTALAFQLVFWLIGGDPLRYRALMPAAVLEKIGFVVPAAVLIARGGMRSGTLAAAAVDLALGIGFALAWRVTPRPTRAA